MNNQSQKSQKQQNKKKLQQRRSAPQSQRSLVLPKSIMIMPDRFRTHLRYWKSLAFDLGTTSYAAARFQPSGAFDIDPTASGVKPAGFDELAAFYSSYRVSKSKCVVEIVGTASTSAVQVTLLPTNLDPGATPVAAYITSSREQPYAISKMAPSQGGPTTKLSRSMSTQKIFGSPMTKYDDNFSALINSIPVNNWFWVLTLYSLATIPTVTPVLINVFIEIDIDFYDRRFLTRT